MTFGRQNAQKRISWTKIRCHRLSVYSTTATSSLGKNRRGCGYFNGFLGIGRRCRFPIECKAIQEPQTKSKSVLVVSPSADKVDKIVDKVRKNVGYDIPDSVMPQLKCFASFGVGSAELVKLTKMQLVDNDAKGKVLKIPLHSLEERLSWFMENFELTGKELGKAFARDPRILHCSPKTTVAKRVKYLERRGVDKKQMTKIFKKSPMLFRLDVTKSMEPRFKFLEQIGISKNMHATVVGKDPAIMHRSISAMEDNAVLLLEIGFDSENLHSVIIRNPSLLRYNRTTMTRTVYFFQKLGITQSEMVILVSRLPQIFSMSLEKNIMAKCSYFLRTLGWNIHDLSLAPQVLSLSLKGRIQIRHRFLAHKGLFEYYKDFKRRRWLLVTDAVFATSIAKCTLEEYQDFLARVSKTNSKKST